ncbi:hypothetical protein GCM10009775_08810 [Microbacterium aoyamense]|uniref:DUF2255 family protein n=1 Tax=Microbacterium aoyamense TaxID=344166 RepID=A0ABN2PEA9_9MICO|nr:DUF2255 family protein [Microbacterium aoyamense]
MTSWTASDLERVGRADELKISSTRPDSTYRPFVIIWAVRVGDDLYVRSAYGTANPWYRRALRSTTGRIAAGGVEAAVAFVHVDPDDTPLQEAVDAAYHAKYDRYGARIVGTVVGPTAHLSTIRIDPR